MSDNPQDKPEGVYVESVFGLMTQQPLVKMTYGSASVTMSPNEARALALNLLSRAEGADTDAFIVDMFGKRLKQPSDQVAAVLRARRAFRSYEVDTGDPRPEGGRG